MTACGFATATAPCKRNPPADRRRVVHDPFRAILEANAPTFLDEARDPTSGSVDAADLAVTTVPLLFTSGSESPSFFSAVIGELALLVPTAQVATIAGAGHIPHATHPDQWVATLLAFHDTIATSADGARR